MTQIAATNSDCVIMYGALTYAEVHDATEGLGKQGTDYITIGQMRDTGGTWYELLRGMLQFPLTVMAGKTAYSASIFLYGYPSTPATNFSVTIVNGSDIGAVIDFADYGDLLNDTTSYGSISTASFASQAWNIITLNSSGIAAINAAIIGGVIRFGIRSSLDISSTAPPADETDEVTFYGIDTVGKKPLLAINGSGEGTGVIAVVETRFHYVDAYGTERYIEGTVVT